MLKTYLDLLLKSEISDYQNLLSEISHAIKRSNKDKSSEEFLEFIKEEPEFDESKKVIFVYISGLIELLCEDNNLVPPSWIMKSKYFLNTPYTSIHGFVDVAPAYLVCRTRDCFKKRNYFTNENGRR